MATLHGNWISQGYLFLWGETWQRSTALEWGSIVETQPYPFALSHRELQHFLQTLSQTGKLDWSCAENGSAKAKTAKSKGSNFLSSTFQVLALPTLLTETAIVPCYATGPAVDDEPPQDASAGTLSLFPWQVPGISLSLPKAIEFLTSLSLNALDASDHGLGGDLRFWSHIARWSLDLLARSKFLPSLSYSSDALAQASWQVLLDSEIDQIRLETFVKSMPLGCRFYQPSQSTLSIHCPETAQVEIVRFLNQVINLQVSTLAADQSYHNGQPTRRDNLSVLSHWIEALRLPSGAFSQELGIERLEAALRNWITPLQTQAIGKPGFRTCLCLQPPELGSEVWHLDYSLQSVHDPDFLVAAAVVWNHPVEQLVYRGRIIDRPQESLLTGLGLASRLFPPIEISLQSKHPQSCTLTPIQAYEFLKAAAWRLQDSGFGVILPPGLSSLEGAANRLGIRVQADTGSLPTDRRLGLQGLLNFKLDLTIGDHTLSEADLKRLTSMGTPLVQVNGEWLELRPQDVRAAQNFFASGKRQTMLSLQDVLRMSAGDTQIIEKLPVVSFEAGPLQELIATLTTGNLQIEAIDPPPSFRGTLRPYQARGVGWLTFLERWGLGACLADDMGLGKTIQAIAFLLHLKEEEKLENPCLLVCPTSVLSNWEREVRKFGPKLKVLVYHGNKRPKGKAFAKAIKDKDLVITSYALLHRASQEIQGQTWQVALLDEAQNIKNAESKQSQVARQIPAQFRMALTGTPVENRLSELWAILEFLNPGYLGPKNFFQRRFAVPIEKYGDTASLKTLKSLVQPFILRRLKTDRDIIQDLPEKQEMAVFCGLSAQQATLYQTVVEQSMAAINDADGIQRRGLILSLLVKLKQICNHPAHYLKEDSIGTGARSGKLQRLEEMLEEVLLEGDRALLFTQFAEWGKLLQAHLAQKFNREVLFLYGGSSKKQRELMVDRFQHDPQGPPLLILSLKAGGVGLNLTRANHVFHVDRWWNPAVENQATDRAFRIGQTRNVQVHKFVCTGTLEEKIHDLIESKKALAEQVVGTGEEWLTELDSNQLRELLLLDRNAIIEEENDTD